MDLHSIWTQIRITSSCKVPETPVWYWPNFLQTVFSQWKFFTSNLKSNIPIKNVGADTAWHTDRQDLHINFTFFLLGSTVRLINKHNFFFQLSFRRRHDLTIVRVLSQPAHLHTWNDGQKHNSVMTGNSVATKHHTLHMIENVHPFKWNNFEL